MMRLALIVMLSAATLAACTTIVRGFNDTFEVRTDPAGATVTTTLDSENAVCAATPCEIQVSRKDSFIARIEKDGYHTVRIVVRNSEFIRAEIDDRKAFEAEAEAAGILPSDIAMMITSGAFIASITEGTLVGSLELIFGNAYGGIAAFYAAPVTAGVDSVTGSQLNLYPNPVNIILIPETVEVPEAYKLRRTPEDELLFTNMEKAQPDG